MLHAGILMSVILPSMVIVGQIGLLITELMEERMHARELVVVKGTAAHEQGAWEEDRKLNQERSQ